MSIWTDIVDWFTRKRTMPKDWDFGKTHTVQEGDTLQEIAIKHYGNPVKAEEIYQLNSNILSDPDKIYPGQVLRLP